jgi:hypothetical protein
MRSFQGEITIGTDSFIKKTDWRKTDDRLASNVKGSTLEAEFGRTQTAIFGETNRHSGYAKIIIRNKPCCRSNRRYLFLD